MEQVVRIFLMVCIGAMALSVAQLGFNTARYVERAEIVSDAYLVPQRKSPPVERAATSSHATSSLERSSDRTAPFEEAPALPALPQ